MAVGAASSGSRVIDPVPVRDLASVGVALAAGVALAVSVGPPAAPASPASASAGAEAAARPGVDAP